MNNKLDVVISEATGKKFPRAFKFLKRMSYNRGTLMLACVEAMLDKYPQLVDMDAALLSSNNELLLALISKSVPPQRRV